jgi:hypothetical protein
MFLGVSLAPVRPSSRRKIMPVGLSELFTSARQMLAALSAANGTYETFLQKGLSQLEHIQALETEQEMLQTALSNKTSELESAIHELKNWRFEAETIIKLAYYQRQARKPAHMKMGFSQRGTAPVHNENPPLF